jgi:hypothetical protein
MNYSEAVEGNGSVSSRQPEVIFFGCLAKLFWLLLLSLVLLIFGAGLFLGVIMAEI